MIGKYSNPGQFNPRHNLLDNLAHEPKPLRHIKLEQRQDGTTSRWNNVKYPPSRISCALSIIQSRRKYRELVDGCALRSQTVDGMCFVGIAKGHSAVNL